MARHHRFFFAIAIGAAAGIACYIQLIMRECAAGDFTWPWQGARLLLAGQDPYSLILDPYGEGPTPLYYPLPAVLLAIPFAPLNAPLAGALFFAIGTGLLAYALTRDGWSRMPIFLSAPFWIALYSVQWSPLLTAAALLPGLSIALFAKPNLGLPILAAHPDRRRMLLSALLVLSSFLAFPTWPLGWLAALRHNLHSSPAAIFPGMLLLLAALRWRAPEARLLLALAILPQRLVFYDQLPLWLLCGTRREALTLAILSWFAFFGFLLLQGASWLLAPPWVVALIYLPALVLVLRKPLAAPAPRPASQRSEAGGAIGGLSSPELPPQLID